MMESSEALLVEMATEAILVDLSDTGGASSSLGGPLNLVGKEERKKRNSFYSLPKTLSEEDDPFGILDHSSKPNVGVRQDTEEPDTGTLIQLETDTTDRSEGFLGNFSSMTGTFNTPFSSTSTGNMSDVFSFGKAASSLSEMVDSLDSDEPNWEKMMNEAQFVTSKLTDDKKTPASMCLDTAGLASYSPCGVDGGMLDSPLALIETSDNFLVVLTPDKSPARDLRNQFEKIKLVDEGGGGDTGEVEEGNKVVEGTKVDEGKVKAVEATPPRGEGVKPPGQVRRRLSSIKENLEPPRQTQSRFGTKAAVKKPNLTKPKLPLSQSAPKKPSVVSTAEPLASKASTTASGGPRSSVGTPTTRPRSVGGSSASSKTATPALKKSTSARTPQMSGTPRPPLSRSTHTSGTPRPPLSKTPASSLRPVGQRMPSAKLSLNHNTRPRMGRPQASTTLPVRPTGLVRPGSGPVRPLNSSLGAQPRGGGIRGSGFQRPTYQRQGSALSNSLLDSTPGPRNMVPPSPISSSNSSLLCSTPGLPGKVPRPPRSVLPSPITKY